MCGTAQLHQQPDVCALAQKRRDALLPTLFVLLHPEFTNVAGSSNVVKAVQVAVAGMVRLDAVPCEQTLCQSCPHPAGASIEPRCLRCEDSVHTAQSGIAQAMYRPNALCDLLEYNRY